MIEFFMRFIYCLAVWFLAIVGLSVGCLAIVSFGAWDLSILKEIVEAGWEPVRALVLTWVILSLFTAFAMEGV